MQTTTSLRGHLIRSRTVITDSITLDLVTYYNKDLKTLTTSMLRKDSLAGGNVSDPLGDLKVLKVTKVGRFSSKAAQRQHEAFLGYVGHPVWLGWARRMGV